MEIDQCKLDKAVIKAKKWIATNRFKKEVDLIGLAEKYNIEVCLVVADFKCQRCGNPENLTIHHLIMRKAKHFMDFWRYASQRYYWANMIVLCKDCHSLYHHIFGKDKDEMGVISQEKISKIKAKYLI